jgi:hypothetical protein
VSRLLRSGATRRVPMKDVSSFAAGVVSAGAYVSAQLSVVIGITQFPSTLHPNIDSMAAKSYVLGIGQRPFTAYDPKWQLICMLCTELPTIENGLAKFEKQAGGRDGIALTYTIRPDATWGDGTPVSTDDVLFTTRWAGPTERREQRRAIPADHRDRRGQRQDLRRPPQGGLRPRSLLPECYGHWLADALRGEFGYSRLHARPTLEGAAAPARQYLCADGHQPGAGVPARPAASGSPIGTSTGTPALNFHVSRRSAWRVGRARGPPALERTRIRHRSDDGARQDGADSHDAMLRHVPTDRIRKPGPLPHQQQAGPMQYHHALLLGSLHGNKAHKRPAHRLADRLSVGRIVLLALDVGLHVARRHQSDIVPERAQLSCPIVPGGTRLDADPTGLNRRKERQHPRPPQTGTTSMWRIPRSVRSATYGGPGACQCRVRVCFRSR